jgi:hypothetical protein
VAGVISISGAAPPESLSASLLLAPTGSIFVNDMSPEVSDLSLSPPAPLGLPGRYDKDSLETRRFFRGTASALFIVEPNYIQQIEINFSTCSPIRLPLVSKHNWSSLLCLSLLFPTIQLFLLLIFFMVVVGSMMMRVDGARIVIIFVEEEEDE